MSVTFPKRILFLSALCAISCTAAPKTPPPPPPAIPTARIKFAIAPENILYRDGAFYLVIENTSNAPQIHYDEDNSNGYYNISIEWSTPSGKSGRATRQRYAWLRNRLTFSTLNPGDVIIRRIEFGQNKLNEWQGWPESLDERTITLKAVYHQESFGNHPVWTGTISTEPHTFKLY